MQNVIQTWLFLIGTPERARKLRARVDTLSSPPYDENFGQEPPQCPTTVLFGAEISRKLYASPYYRPALDAWDTGEVSKSDLRRYCLHIERNGSKDSTFDPYVFERLFASTIPGPRQRSYPYSD